MEKTSGFTLVEVLVAIFISMVVMASASSLFLSQQKSAMVQSGISDIQQSLRAAMDFMARDIRLAGFSGSEYNKSGSFGFIDVGFSDYAGSPSANGSGYVEFSWDADDDGALDSGETISYSLSDTSSVAPGSIALMRKRDSEATRQPMAGYIIALGLAYAYDADQDGELDRDAAGNIIWAVDSDNDKDWDNLDSNGDGRIDAADLGGGATGRIAGTDTGTALRYQDIRAVRVWLLGRSLSPDSKFVDNRIYVVGRDVIQPNDHFRHRLLERTVLCRNVGL